jgi:hypothetical protein
MIKLKDTRETIIAVRRNIGWLYEITKENFLVPMEYTGNLDGVIATGKYATGALALWEDPARNMKMLIAGIQGGLSTGYNSSTSYSHGYVEFEINSEGSLDTDTSRRDSNNLKSVDDTDRYTASLGKRPINHLFQAPEEIDTNMTFFASTQTSGLWSYRYRDNEGWRGSQWNAEE